MNNEENGCDRETQARVNMNAVPQRELTAKELIETLIKSLYQKAHDLELLRDSLPTRPTRELDSALARLLTSG